MQKRIEKELKRIAVATDEPEAAVIKEYEELTKAGANPMTAIGQIKAKRRMAFGRINATYHMLPLEVTGPREREITNRDGTKEVHHYTDILALFNGATQRGGEPEPFILSLGLRDEDQAKADDLQMMHAYGFKGALDTNYNRMYLKRDEEFHDLDDETLEGVMLEMLDRQIEALMPLDEIYKTDDKGEYVLVGENVLVTAYVSTLNQYEGGFTLVCHDIGVDPITVWPPRDVYDPNSFSDGDRLLINGRLSYKNELQINAYNIIHLDESVEKEE